MSASTDKFAIKIPLQLKCSNCEASDSIKIRLDDASFDWTCAKCGFRHPSFLGLDFTIGVLLLEKSRHEIAVEQDFSMAIVLAAMAFESQLSHLFGKWRQIDTLRAGTYVEPAQLRAQLEEEMRHLGPIDQKISEVSKLLVGKDLDAFVSDSPDISKEVTASFQNIRVGTMTTDFQRHLFWPRNAIVHWGDVKHSYQEAADCYSFARLGLFIFYKMDEDRRQRLDSSLAGH